MRTKPFTEADVMERAGWPEIQAALRGPESYDELGILTPAQRRELVRLARIEPTKEKPFLDEVTCVINGYRRRKRSRAQERPAAVAESTRQLIAMVTAYARDMARFPDSLICELKPPLPAAEWFEQAGEKLRRTERMVEGHRRGLITQDLSYHAFAMQRIAVAHSDYLANSRRAMRSWLTAALLTSGEQPGKNGMAAYLRALMLPRAVKSEGSSADPVVE